MDRYKVWRVGEGARSYWPEYKDSLGNRFKAAYELARPGLMEEIPDMVDFNDVSKRLLHLKTQRSARFLGQYVEHPNLAAGLRVIHDAHDPLNHRNICIHYLDIGLLHERFENNGMLRKPLAVPADAMPTLGADLGVAERLQAAQRMAPVIPLRRFIPDEEVG